MRKAGKKRIAAAMAQYADWRRRVDARLANLSPRHTVTIRQWADDVRSAIEAGDLSICTTALARSVLRAIENFESGYYIDVTPDGGFRCAC